MRVILAAKNPLLTQGQASQTGTKPALARGGHAVDIHRRMDAPSSVLQQFGDGIWLADGAEVGVAGFCYPTRAAIIRLSDRGLLVWSPVALSPALRAGVEALGEVQHIVAPNSLHHLFLHDWRDAFPMAKVHAPPGLRRKRPDIAFDADLDDGAASPWADELEQVVIRGNLITTEVVFFHVASRTVLFADLIQHFARGSLSGWRALVARLDLMTELEPQVPRKFRAAFIDRASARASIQRVLAWPADRVVMAHTPPVLNDGQAFLERTFRWL